MKLTLDGLVQHLKKSKEDVVSNDPVWVVGNESVDIDSVVSSLMYAYFLEATPVINCSRDEFACKTEVLFLLDKLNISAGILLFRDELKIRPGKIVLVDHNELSANLHHLGDVWQIIDHHCDLKKYPGIEFARIEKVGSCSTIIFDLIEKKIEVNDYGLLKMILAPILLDTFNLDSRAGKATPLDHQVVKIIIDRTSIEPISWFNDLLQARTDISKLTSRQLLHKDCKVWSDFVISTIPIPLADLIGKVENEIEDFFKESGKELYIIMSLFQADEFERQMLIFVGDEWSLEEKVIQALQKEGLNLMPINIKGGYVCFKQKNVIFSRKEVAPMIQEVFRGGVK